MGLELEKGLLLENSSGEPGDARAAHARSSPGSRANRDAAGAWGRLRWVRGMGQGSRGSRGMPGERGPCSVGLWGGRGQLLALRSAAGGGVCSLRRGGSRVTLGLFGHFMIPSLSSVPLLEEDVGSVVSLGAVPVPSPEEDTLPGAALVRHGGASVPSRSPLSPPRAPCPLPEPPPPQPAPQNPIILEAS